MGYQNLYDRDGRYVGYSSDSDGFDSFANGPWWLMLVIVGAGILYLALPVIALILIGIFL